MSDDVLLRCEGPLGRSRDWVWLVVFALAVFAASVYLAIERHPLFLLLLVAAPLLVLTSIGHGAAVVGGELVFRNGRLAKRTTIPLREIRELRWKPAKNSSKTLVLQTTHGPDAIDHVITGISVEGRRLDGSTGVAVTGRPGSLFDELELLTGRKASVSETVDGPDAGLLRGAVALFGLICFVVVPIAFGLPAGGAPLLILFIYAVDAPSARILDDQLVVRGFWRSKNRVVRLEDIANLRMVPVVGTWTMIWVLRLTLTDSQKPERVWAIRERRPGYPCWSTTVNKPTYSVGPILRELLDRTGLTLEG